MSYDYDALVQEFWTARHKAKDESEQDAKRPHLVQAIQAAETLSSHCPMTPLLWIQYASTLGELVESSMIEYQTVQLGLLEFPGSLLLQLRAVAVAPSETSDQKQALEAAVQAVGLGSHRNEDHLVVQLYRKLADVSDDPQQVFVRRSRCPMRQQNETLMAEFTSFVQSRDLQNTDAVLSTMEEGRIWESKVLRQLSAHEDSLEAIYHTQGLPRIPLNEEGELVDWEAVMNSKQLGMGLGNTDLSSAFIRYAKATQRVKGHKGTFDPHDLAVSVFERAVAECPTSEELWLAYVTDLCRFRNGVERLSSVTERAVRNCPYSLRLAQQRIFVMEDLAAASMAVIDPDELLKLARECLSRKFLPPSANRELYVAVTMVMKRRIMHILANHEENTQTGKRPKKRKRLLRYDDEEPLNKKGNKDHLQPLDDEEREEIDDLLEDLRETYEDIIAILESPYDKAWVLKERAWSEALLLSPLEKAIESEESTKTASSKLLGTWDQALNAHQPPIPEACRLFVDVFAMCQSASSPRDVLTKLRNIRFLYGQAFDNKNIPKEVEAEHRSMLSVVGHLWLSWEKCFGSERSLVRAKQRMDGKAPQIPKHELDVGVEDVPDSKRSKREEGFGQAIIDQTQTTEAASVDENDGKKSSVPTKSVHPFTVKIQKLSPTTSDMEIVEAFRPRCGSIVHTRIIRHKDGKSKGWALLQFEDKESVMKALELNDVLGIQGKTVLVERSHMPAVPLVPPGMHKVSARGDGKVSKRNEKRKQRIVIS